MQRHKKQTSSWEFNVKEFQIFYARKLDDFQFPQWDNNMNE